MEINKPKKEVENYFDDKGKLKAWPSKRNKKLLVLDYLAQYFEDSRKYTEKEINEILNELHLFNDAPLIRRELFEMKYLDRKLDCSAYWKRA